MKEAWAQDRAGACQKAGLDPDTVSLDEDGDMLSPVLMSLSMKQVDTIATCVVCHLESGVVLCVYLFLSLFLLSLHPSLPVCLSVHPSLPSCLPCFFP